ncbi:MAG TPA: hypothetical protein VMT24_03805 [Aggregatilineaceae bacterium]|nr:hypothetical protein [Aggregatilineaceae bacterium]
MQAGIATETLRDVVLAPVALSPVGNVCFVVDGPAGSRRRVLKHRYADAAVTVWEVAK